MSESSAWIPVADAPAYLAKGWRLKKLPSGAPDTDGTQANVEWPYTSPPLKPDREAAE